MSIALRVPAMSENVDHARLVSLLVSVGDTIHKDQPIAELETDKATAEVPAEADGVVREDPAEDEGGRQIQVAHASDRVEEQRRGPEDQCVEKDLAGRDERISFK